MLTKWMLEYKYKNLTTHRNEIYNSELEMRQAYVMHNNNDMEYINGSVVQLDLISKHKLNFG